MEVATLAKNKWLQVAVVSAVPILGGVGVFYILKKRKTKPEEEEPKQLSFFDMYPDQLEELLNSPGEIFMPAKENVTQIVPEPDPEPVPMVNIFGKGEDDWDDEVEKASRSSEAPYILHQTEFLESDMGYHQETVTYYAGDDIMANQEDNPMYNYKGLMGELRFGHGSNDKNVVYIRNESFHTEWEVLLHPGTYSYEVLGEQLEDENETELKHSVQKFRRE